jgi:peptidoglycan/LPS O-acetylase OafA/YrhL
MISQDKLEDVKEGWQSQQSQSCVKLSHLASVMPISSTTAQSDENTRVEIVDQREANGRLQANSPNALQSRAADKKLDNNRRPFRADLQGLRSMAAILIAMGHIWTPSASGGVGVFYFIGGFFVIGSLHRKCSANGQIHVGEFLDHTFSRIVPEAYAAIVLIALLVCTWLSPMDRADNLTDGVSSALFVTNWWFRYKNTDYLARDTNLSPYLLFWSLADIVQIYAMNAVVYWLLTKCVPKSRLDFAGIVWLLFQVASSFFYLVYLLSAGGYETAYFETPLWVWMFAGGALTSRFGKKLHVSELASASLCVMALLLIVTVFSCILTLGVVPTQLRFGLLCAAVFVVLAGETPTPSKLLSIIFGNRVFVHLGNNSYFIFLLHWPIVLAYIQVTGQWDSSLLRGSTILAITLVLSELCSRCFFWLRSCKLHKPSIQFMLLWVPLNLLMLQLAYSQAETISFHLPQATFLTSTMSNSPTLSTALYPGALAMTARIVDSTRLDIPVRPDPSAAGKDNPRIYNMPEYTKQHHNYHGHFGVIGSGTVVAIMGASHIAQWMSAMEDLAIMHGWELRVHSKHSCDFYIGSRGTSRQRCDEWLAETIADLQESPPTFLFVLGTQALDPTSEIAMDEEAVPFYASMRKLGTTVVALRDNPRTEGNIARCVQARIPRDYQKACSPKLSMYNNTLMRQVAASATHDVFIDTSDFFCNGKTCPAVIGNVLVYRDQHHITGTYMHTLVPLLERKLRAQVPSMFQVRETIKDVVPRNSTKLKAVH